MNKKSVLSYIVGLGVVLAAPGLAAEEQAAPAQGNQPAQPAAPAQEAPAQQVTDGGTEALAEAQAEKEVQVPERQEAEDVLRKLMEKRGWDEGWNEEKSRFIAVGTVTFKSQDPAKQKDFQRRRRLATKEAVLLAKAKVLQFILQEMSAENQIITPGTDLNKAMNAEIEQLMEDVARQKAILADLLDEKNHAEAEVLRGTPFSKRLDDLLAAAIKKLDKEYDANKHDKAAAARYKAAVENLKREKAHFEELVKKAKAQKNNVVEKQKSSVRTFSRMPLFGASVMLQTESWDKDGTYQISVMLVWSNVLERAARAVVTGEKYSIKPNEKNAEIHEWLRKQDLASMVGPRQYVDNKGNRWFLGIAAQPQSRKLHPRVRHLNQQTARLWASQDAVFSVFADVKVMEAAEEMMNVRSAGKDAEGNLDFTEQTAGTLARNLEQKVESFKVRGGMVLLAKTVKHPVTNDDIYVVVYGFNPAHYAPALKAWERNYATKTQMLRHQTVERGRQAALDDAVNAAKNDPKDFKRGYNQQNKSLNKELQSRQPQKGGVRVYNQGSGTKPAPAKSTSGTFGGDSNVSDDF